MRMDIRKKKTGEWEKGVKSEHCRKRDRSSIVVEKGAIVWNCKRIE
jgi:hypothetical protein